MSVETRFWFILIYTAFCVYFFIIQYFWNLPVSDPQLPLKLYLLYQGPSVQELLDQADLNHSWIQEGGERRRVRQKSARHFLTMFFLVCVEPRIWSKNPPPALPHLS